MLTLKLCSALVGSVKGDLSPVRGTEKEMTIFSNSVITVKIMKVQITSLQEGMKYKSGKQLGDKHSGKDFLLNVNIYIKRIPF